LSINFNKRLLSQKRINTRRSNNVASKTLYIQQYFVSYKKNSYKYISHVRTM